MTGPTAPLLLLVDDMPEIRLLLASGLGKAGYRTLQAEDGAKGVELWWQEKPDLVLMDIKMPVMDGFSACRMIRAQETDATTPILMLTGSDDLDSIEQAFDAGASDFITKPVNLPLLSQRIRYALRDAQRERELCHARSMQDSARALAGLVFWDYDPEQGRLRWLDDTAAILPWLEPLPDSLEALLAAIHQEDRQHLQVAFHAAVKEGIAFNLEVRTLDAQSHIVVKMVGKRDESTQHIIGALQDITQVRSLKRAEQASREAFETLDQLLLAAPVVVYECLPTPELPVTYVSPSVERLFGYSRDELLHQPTWPTMIHPDDIDDAATRVHALLAGHGPMRLNYRLRHQDGRYLRVQSEKRLICDANGRPSKVVGAILDVEDVYQLNWRLETLGRQLPGFIYQYHIDTDGKRYFPYASSRSMAIYGAHPEELARSDAAAFDVIHPDDQPGVRRAVEASAKTLSDWRCEYRVLHPHGHELWVEGRATPQRLEDGSTLWHGYIADVSERKRLQLALEKSEARFRQLATVDMLTGAPNRRHFMHCLQSELARMQRHGGEACLAMFDADHFKRINDTYGHAAGDRVLQALVRTGREQLRECDVLGRMGGEEFAILMPATGYQGALILAERFRQAVAELQVTPKETEAAVVQEAISVTVSLGVIALRPTDSADSALERVDRPLYQAKALGRNRICGERDQTLE